MCHSVRIWRGLVKMLLKSGRKAGRPWRNPVKCYLISARPRFIKKTDSCQGIGASLVLGWKEALCRCKSSELLPFLWGQSSVLPGDLTINASRVAAGWISGHFMAWAGRSACRHGCRLHPGSCCIADLCLTLEKQHVFSVYRRSGRSSSDDQFDPTPCCRAAA